MSMTIKSRLTWIALDFAVDCVLLFSVSVSLVMWPPPHLWFRIVLTVLLVIGFGVLISRFMRIIKELKRRDKLRREARRRAEEAQHTTTQFIDHGVG
jgi:hypothetical protein